MHKSFAPLALAACLLTSGTAGLHAQTFEPPHAYEFTFGDPHMVRPQTTSCYSLDEAYTLLPGGYTGDLYLAGWGLALTGASSEVTWQLTAHTDPTTILMQGSIPYQGVADMEVGSIRNAVSNTTNILVAYYRLGVGHFLDIYDIVSGTATLTNSVQLSNTTAYGRIRIDCHAVYEAAIVWDNPGVGIQTIASNNGSWNPANISTLNGTIGESGPDIAFCTDESTHTTNLHYVYYNSGTGFVTEASVDLGTILGTPGLITPAIGDYNYVGILPSRLVLDCPDFYAADNWAYTYTDGARVFVRYIDYLSTATATTTSVNTGALGNVALGSPYEMSAPALSYGSGALGSGTDQITVAWYITEGGAASKYIALQMRADGTSWLNSGDYMDLPNATADFYPYAGIALSKSDVKATPVYLYATYYDYNDATNEYQLHHAFHKWGDVAFKGQGTAKFAGNAITAAKINTYPNPFNSSFTTYVELEEAGMLRLEVWDLTGRLVGSFESNVTEGKHEIKIKDIEKLAPGTYLLNTALNNKKIGTQKITRQ